MKTLMTIAVLLVSYGTVSAHAGDDLPPLPADKSWKLIWHDEFIGSNLDETKWEVMPDAPP